MRPVHAVLSLAVASLIAACHPSDQGAKADSTATSGLPSAAADSTATSGLPSATAAPASAVPAGTPAPDTTKRDTTKHDTTRTKKRP